MESGWCDSSIRMAMSGLHDIDIRTVEQRHLDSHIVTVGMQHLDGGIYMAVALGCWLPNGRMADLGQQDGSNWMAVGEGGI